MARKKKVVETGPKPNDGWVYATEMQINGRNVSPGTELKISGQRGRYRFVKHVRTEKDIEWLDVWGGPKGAECLRSFTLDKVKRVHYKNQTYQNLAIEHKEKKIAMKNEKLDIELNKEQ